MPRLPRAPRAASQIAVALSVLGVLAAPHAARAAEEAQAAIPAETMAEGESLYLKNCRLCHGTKGTSGKRLSGNESLADAEYVASTILLGPGYMTPFAEHLSDEEIALITTYVRNAWGHAYGAMEAAEVAPLR